ncbi:MAG TPA: hypothetical protein VLH10_18770 [Yinghuangia sp.]|uniref:hypothetical protein n=1 Tax=Yinghuangia sp. YIM S10712 TaxID=3436930 RepID=UPI002C50B2E3|nr:hypothetical protein [Yinghuangia sp.]
MPDLPEGRPPPGRNCDRIAVIEHGRVSAIGTHNSLLRTSATYRAYCREQSVA